MSITLLQAAHPVVGRLGWALVHFVWQGVLIACLYLIARTLLVRPENARIRYALSCAALAAMMAAPVITFATNGRKNPAPAIARMASPYTARPVAGPHSRSIPFEALPATATVTPIADGMTWLVVIWLIGGCLVASRLRALEGAPVPPEWRDARTNPSCVSGEADGLRFCADAGGGGLAQAGDPASGRRQYEGVLTPEEKARYTADYAAFDREAIMASNGQPGFQYRLSMPQNACRH